MAVDGVSSCFWDCKLCSLGGVSFGDFVGGTVDCDGLDGLEGSVFVVDGVSSCVSVAVRLGGAVASFLETFLEDFFW